VVYDNDQYEAAQGVRRKKAAALTDALRAVGVEPVMRATSAAGPSETWPSAAVSPSKTPFMKTMRHRPPSNAAAAAAAGATAGATPTASTHSFKTPLAKTVRKTPRPSDNAAIQTCGQLADGRTASVVCDFAMHSQHGTRHGEMNQDGVFCRRVASSAGEVVVGAVFDGHGLLGELASAAAVARLELLLSTPSAVDALVDDTPAWVVWAFGCLQESVAEAHNDPPAQYRYPGKPGSEPLVFEREDVGGRFGVLYNCTSASMPAAQIDFGCTAAMAVVVGDVLTTGCIGDAGAVLCVKTEEGEEAGRMLSVAHTAAEPTEVARLERDFEGKAIVTADGYLAPLDDELSQYEVQITRSLGHVLLREFGITSTPDVRQQTLLEGEHVGLLLCSDGITDELQPRDIADRVSSAATADEACRALVGDAQAFCMDRDKVDDCTALVMKFNVSTLSSNVNC
jgi:serine/threonine protein phosphatase PrpC